jgi:hypothetical protein
MIIRLKRRKNKSKEKEYINISFIVRRPKFIRRKKTLKTISHNNSFFNIFLLSHILKRSKLD